MDSRSLELDTPYPTGMFYDTLQRDTLYAIKSSHHGKMDIKRSWEMRPCWGWGCFQNRSKLLAESFVKWWDPEPHHDHISPFHFSREKDRGYEHITQGKCCIKWKTGWSRSVLYICTLGSLTRPSSYSIANNQTSKIQTSGSAVTKLVHILAKKMWTRYLATVERYEKTPKEDEIRFPQE